MDDGKVDPTTAVIIALEDEFPKEHFVYLRRYKKSIYIPSGATTVRYLDIKQPSVKHQQQSARDVRRNHTTTRRAPSTNPSRNARTVAATTAQLTMDASYTKPSTLL